VGLAGLIVAGIFAAAQSTVSTSMNSTATAVVTDFLRPLRLLRTERAYLNWARALTLALGVTGTLLGLLFVQPDIRSLFEQFIKVIGLFMGVLGGLFALGMLTRRATAWPTLIGALIGASVMGVLPLYTRINGYLYAAIGITVCFASGYLLSLIIPQSRKPLEGLTVRG
jgi:Na+/proline symporter